MLDTCLWRQMLTLGIAEAGLNSIPLSEDSATEHVLEKFLKRSFMVEEMPEYGFCES